jgi:hypothetical protein
MSSRQEDSNVAERQVAHHRLMTEYFGRLNRALADAAGSGIDGAQARRDLEDWIRDVLVPHAEEEEASTYRAAGRLPEGALLIKSMIGEHELIRQIAGHMAAANSDIEAAAFARALFDLFDAHQRKEDELILPLLVRSNEVSLVEVIGGSRAIDRGGAPGGHGH